MSEARLGVSSSSPAGEDVLHGAQRGRLAEGREASRRREHSSSTVLRRDVRGEAQLLQPGQLHEAVDGLVSAAGRGEGRERRKAHSRISEGVHPHLFVRLPQRG